MTKMTISQASAAPWRKDFKAHVESMAMPTFVLATTDISQQYPRARTCVYRGLWGSLPPNERNPAPRNPGMFESDMPVFTTDARMEKARELCPPPHGQFDSKGGIPGTGGGGFVEAVYWVQEHGTQWRVRGEAYLLGPDIDDSDSDRSREVRDILRTRMRRRDPPPPHWSADDDEKGREWSFSREVTAHFGNLSPAMRGSFRQPPPGKPLDQSPPPEDGHLGLGKKVEDLEDAVARSNFRVVVIVPAEVDRTDLSDPEHPRRWLYTHQAGGSGAWDVVEVWP
ncbi:hypothetical protein V8F06_008614 [Rhypophila decipiens]